MSEKKFKHFRKILFRNEKNLNFNNFKSRVGWKLTEFLPQTLIL